MAFELGDISKAKYFPELLPGGDFAATLAAGAELSPRPLDLRRLPGVYVELDTVVAVANGAVDVDLEIEARADDHADILNTVALTADTPHNAGWRAFEQLQLRLRNAGTGSLTNTRIDYGLWVDNLNAAVRLANKRPLTARDRALIEKRHLDQSVAKGMLPLPRGFGELREWYPVGRGVRTITADTITATEAGARILDLKAEPGQVLVLQKLFISDTANTVHLVISRDEDPDYVTFNGRGRLVAPDCWIPALKELIIDAVGVGGDVAGVHFRFEVGTYMLTDVMRARWSTAIERLGLDLDIPQETIDQVEGGIL